MKVSRSSRILPVLTLALAASACAPTVQLAEAPPVLSSGWQAGSNAGPAQPGPTQDLGEAFQSAQLRQLIARALAANADIAVAAARIGKARAELRIARGEMLPVVSAAAGISGTRTDDKTASLFSFSGGFAGIDIGFDLDLFGRGKAQRRSARDRILAAAFDRDAVALIVEAEVARAYVQYAALTDRIAFLDRNIQNARELERIIGVRMREGVATRVDVGLQAIEVRQQETDRLRLAEARDRTRNALAVLVGEEAPRFRMAPTSLDDVGAPLVGTVQPGELLVRRPDIRAAEARISAASGDVAQARAAFLPSLRLSASGLIQAATLGGPIGSTLSAGAGLLAPIFDRGRLNGRLASAKADQVESVELYRKALLEALGEAEDALTSVEHSRARRGLIEQIVEEARITARLARRQYLEGEADLRNVLDAERLLVQAEDARAVATQEVLTALADLYQAMGGAPREWARGRMAAARTPQQAAR
jgi:NodT family efflux transporter outer membrane factor (OMF) lipoprotein